MSAPSPVDRLARAWLDRDSTVYGWFVVVCTVFAASTFYGHMLVQTRGTWSAPLDEVFVHFDHARSFARGYPFQWTEGNGYSSGNGSLSYPVLLAVGYWLGFRKLLLVVWAAVLAQLGVALFLHQSGRLVDGVTARLDPVRDREHAWVKYLFPPAILSVGALEWTLWSGMEYALLLGVWGLCIAALEHQLASAEPVALRRRSLWVGAAGTLLVATVPTGVLCALGFGLFGAFYARREHLVRSRRDFVAVLASAVAPPLALLVSMGVANRLLTGEFATSDDLTSLLVHQPYATWRQKLVAHREQFGGVIDRLLFRHLADSALSAPLVPALAMLPVFSGRLRPVALLVWGQLVAWLWLISVNMHLAVENDRRAMPAVAWLLLLAAMGLGLVVHGALDAVHPRSSRRAQLTAVSRVALGVGIAAGYWRHQAPRLRAELWSFGRASRNLFDQHITVGYLLERLDVKRVLVGEAGGIVYAADRSGIDLTGLGGFRGYPFARATLNGLGAALEQLERVPVDERPDAMAIHPGRWGELPVHFGRFITLVPSFGNVVRGGGDKAIYRTDWSPLDREGKPRTTGASERILDGLDFADVTNEAEHGLDLPRAGVGFVRYRVLADPTRREHDLFDAGRVLSAGTRASADLAMPRSGGRLVLRLAPEQATRIEIRAEQEPLGTLELEPSPGQWVEAGLTLPAALPPRARIAWRALSGEAVLYHAWTVGPR
ncbi:MAG: hypothetical protein FJ096_03640 [Deltaproteobacteria bacterium]|nr:hypothetical protein [Deltaproteobacteria bacterium]